MTDSKTKINKACKHIGMFLQSFNLFPHLSTKKNIMLAPIEVKKLFDHVY